MYKYTWFQNLAWVIYERKRAIYLWLRRKLVAGSLWA